MKIGGSPSSRHPHNDPLSQLNPARGLPWVCGEFKQLVKSNQDTQMIPSKLLVDLVIREYEAISLSLCISRTERELAVWRQMLACSLARINKLEKRLEADGCPQSLTLIKERAQSDLSEFRVIPLILLQQNVDIADSFGNSSTCRSYGSCAHSRSFRRLDGMLEFFWIQLLSNSRPVVRPFEHDLFHIHQHSILTSATPREICILA